MEPDSLAGEFLSPESTVTSLLSSSGHLRSSLLVPERTATFRYRNKDYDSASAALDAYIADFESSCQNCRSRTGKLVLPQSSSTTPSRFRASTLRNKDVLRESLTERELDFLNLPVSSLRHRVNRDRLSMTTDELLSIPYDGSLPVTHTSAFLQGLMSQSGGSKPHCPPSCPGCRACTGLGSNHSDPRLNHLHPQLIQTPRSSRFRGRLGADKVFPVSSFKSADRAAAPEWAEPSASHPLWLSSISDQKFPAWLQDCDLSDPPPSESKLCDNEDLAVFPPVAPRGGAPSWVAELEEDESRSQVDSQLSLRDLRLQFAEQISQLAAERRSSDNMETLFRDNRIESLIQKADQVLNSLYQRGEGAVSPVHTEDLLGSSSHQPSFPLDSAAAAGGSTEVHYDEAETLGGGLHGNRICKQPGPVEALKQMLFRLQSVEAKLQQQEGEAGAAPTQTERLQTEETLLKQRTEGEAELESVTGGPSLHRALHHLNRLKLLVEEPREKRQEDEKDEDEGRFSSSSTDGLVCTQEKTS